MFKLTQLKPEGSDCTAPYSVELDRKYTVAEFVEAVLSRTREWGDIRIVYGDNNIGDKICDYSHGVLKNEVPEAFKDLRVLAARAHGGWSTMTYYLTAEGYVKKKYEEIEKPGEKLGEFELITDSYGVRTEETNNSIRYCVYKKDDLTNKLNSFKYRSSAVCICKYYESISK